MGKIVFWLVVIFGLLFALRLWNAGKARARRNDAAGQAASPQAMVQCSNCGVFLPKTDARLVNSAYRCQDGGCAAHETP
ncbi:MAG: PP0621 family protein [Betaproteobacteria bacterium]